MFSRITKCTNLPLVIAVGAFLLSFTGCSERFSDLNNPGSSLITTDINVRDTVIYATSSQSFKQIVAMDSRFPSIRQNLLGKHNGYTALTALQFFSSYFPHRDTIKIVSAKLTLRTPYWHGDSSSQFSFNVHKITKGWSETSLTWDSIPAGGAGFYDPTPRGTYAGRIKADIDTMVIALDTAMVREWFLPLTVTSYGIALVPNGGTNVVRGIHSFNVDSSQFWPTLEVIASNMAGTVFDTSKAIIGGDTFVGNLENLNTNTELMYVQAGVVYRSTMKFDVSFIKQGSIINSARLQLDRNPWLTKVSKFTTDSVVAVHALRGGSDSTVFEILSSPGRRKGGTETTFEFDVRHPAQLWVNGKNDGLILRHIDLNEYATLDLFTFFNERYQNAALRPRLVIKYTSDK